MRAATCHPDKPHRAKGLCEKCYRKSIQTETKRLNACASARRWRLNNPDRAYYLDTSKQFKKKYGITLEDYEIMYAAQNGLCAICDRPETIINGKGRKPSRLAVDHRHSDGKVRGLLCFRCNTAAGHIEKHQLADKLSAYLKG